MKTSRITKAAVGAAAVVALAFGTPTAQAKPPTPTHSTQAIAHPCVAVTAYGNGPGTGIRSKNYRAFDRWCDENYRTGGVWYGPWRLKKATADHDRDVRNAGRD